MAKSRTFDAMWVGAICIGTAIPTFAQPTEPAEEESAGLDEIIVTARRKEENLQSTPVAVTAVGAEALQTQQVGDIADLQRTTPNVTVATGAPSSSGFAFISIRGQTNLAPGVAADPAIGIYVDGVYIPRPSQGLFHLDDIQRVEVLRGPQGTLFGRNTTGGALNILTTEPANEFAATARLELGSEDYRSASGMLNLPLNEDSLAARVSYSYNERGGYGQNVTLNRPAADELGSHSVRGKLRFAPAEESWDLTISADYNEQRDSGQMIALTAFDPTVSTAVLNPALSAAFGAPIDLTPFLLAQNIPQYFQTEDNFYQTNGTVFAGDPRLPGNKLTAYGGGANLNVKLGELDLKSITGYRYSNNNGTIDLDASPLNLLATQSGYVSRQYSQEFQLSGDVSALNWITGVYYSRETGEEFSDFQTFGFVNDFLSLISPTPVPPAAIGRNDADVTNVSTGAFAQGYYKLTDRTRLAAGIRYTWDDRDVELHNVTVSGAPGDMIVAGTAGVGPNCNIVPDDGNPANCTQTQKAKFDYPAWTLGVDYQATDSIFLYGKTSGASMAGGWNLRVGSIPAFDPEEVKDVEVGIKTDLLDRRLRANASVFHSWQSKVQRNINSVAQTPNGPVSTQYVRNSGDAQITGLEIELLAAPFSGTELSASLGFMDGSYDDGTFTETQIVNGVPVLVDRSNETLPLLPKRQFNVGATQTIPLSFGELSLHADYAYISSRVFNSGTAAPGSSAKTIADYAALNALSRAPSYGLVNGRFALRFDEPNLEVALWGRNLTDKKYITRQFADLYASGLGHAAAFVGEPRVYGVSATYNFGKE